MAYEGKFAPWEIGSTAYGGLDDFFSGETVRDPNVAPYYYGGVKGYAQQQAAEAQAQAYGAWSQAQQARVAQSDAMGMTRDMALGRGPSLAAQQAKASTDAAMRSNVSMARSGRAGTGGSAMRDAMLANAQAQGLGAQGAAMARAQEQMAATQAYAQQAGAMRGQDLGASEAAYGRQHAVNSAQLEAWVRREEAKQQASTANAQIDAQRDASVGGMIAAGIGAFGMASDERMKNELSRSQLSQLSQLDAYQGPQGQKETPEQRAGSKAGWEALMQYGMGQIGTSDEGSKREIRSLRAALADERAATSTLAKRIAAAGEGPAPGDDDPGPPDLDPEETAAYLDAFEPAQRRPRTEESARDERMVEAALRQAQADRARARGRPASELDRIGEQLPPGGALAEMRAGLRRGDPNARMAASEASEAFAAMRPMAYEYREPGPGAPPGPQVGFSAQSIEDTPAGRAILQRGPDGMLRYDQQKALQMTMAGTADQENRLRAVEALIGSDGTARRLSPAIARVRTARADQQRRMGDYIRPGSR